MASIKGGARKIIFSILSEEQIKRFYLFYYRLRYPSLMEQKKSFGELHSDKIFYVIRPRTDCVEGLMSLLGNVELNLEYAKERGYIPVVDFAHYTTQYADANRPGVNIWENYFTQPSEYSLEEVYQSKNVILSGLEAITIKRDEEKQPFYEIIERMRRTLFPAIDFSEEVICRVEEERKCLDLDYGTTLGLYLRGTDYVAMKPSGHPVQPTVEQAFVEVDRFLCRYPIDKIFLVTEDADICHAVQSKYRGKVVTVSFDTFISGYDGRDFLSKTESVEQLADSPKERGMKYLVKLVLLSKCAYILGGNTKGMQAACTFAEDGFKDMYIFNLGMYGK